jgi:hypothetical protein
MAAEADEEVGEQQSPKFIDVPPPGYAGKDAVARARRRVRVRKLLNKRFEVQPPGETTVDIGPESPAETAPVEDEKPPETYVIDTTPKKKPKDLGKLRAQQMAGADVLAMKGESPADDESEPSETGK